MNNWCNCWIPVLFCVCKQSLCKLDKDFIGSLDRAKILRQVLLFKKQIFKLNLMVGCGSWECLFWWMSFVDVFGRWRRKIRTSSGESQKLYSCGKPSSCHNEQNSAGWLVFTGHFLSLPMGLQTSKGTEWGRAPFLPVRASASDNPGKILALIFFFPFHFHVLSPLFNKAPVI